MGSPEVAVVDGAGVEEGGVAAGATVGTDVEGGGDGGVGNPEHALKMTAIAAKEPSQCFALCDTSILLILPVTRPFCTPAA
jgi:hypothetical protein